MKKALSLLAIVALSMGTVNAYAQDEMAATEEVVTDSAATDAAGATSKATAPAKASAGATDSKTKDSKKSKDKKEGFVNFIDNHIHTIFEPGRPDINENNDNKLLKGYNI